MQQATVGGMRVRHVLIAVLVVVCFTSPCAHPARATVAGDANGDGAVTTADAVLTLKAAVGLTTPTQAQLWAADLNGDGLISLADVVGVLRSAIEGVSFPLNLLLNPGFEAGQGSPRDWSTQGGVVVPAQGRPGLCLRVSLSAPGYAMTVQDVPIAGAASLRVAGWMRTSGMRPGAQPWEGARIFVSFHDALRRQIGGWPEVRTVLTDADWRRYEGSFAVPAGATLLRVSVGLQNCAGTAWYDDLEVTARDKGGRYLAPEANQTTDTTGWFAFPGPRPAAGGPSLVDLSFLNEVPAGSHGFVTVKNGHFAFQDGTRARFWGTNIVASNPFQSHESAAAVAERLAKAGCNMVRLHHMDASWANPNIFDPRYDDTQHFSAESLDRLDYLIAELKKRGIYVYMDLLVHRKFKAGDNVRDWQQVDNGAKVVAHFDPRIIELQKKYAHDLLTHVNKYTGVAYVDEPAIAMMEVINESSLFWADGYQSLPQYYVDEIRSMFEQWCGKRGVTAPAGSVPDLLRKKNRLVIEFLLDTQTAYYQGMRNYLRSIGVKVPITGSNHWENWAADILSNVRLDYLDRHYYWDHPQGGYGPTNTFNNTPMLCSPLSSIVQLGRQRVAGKPLIVTEWNDCWINEYIAEGPMLVAAYACLQDWDGLLQFDFYGPDWPPVMSSPFDIGNKPHVFGQWPAAALLFRRGDVRAAEQVVRGVLTDQSALTGGPAGDDVPSSAVLQHRVELADAPGGPPAALGSAAAWDSDTSELRWDGEGGTITVSTDRTKALVGFTRGKEWALGGVTIKASTPFAAIAVSSLDGQPIEQSKRMAVWAVARAENTGMLYNRTRTSAMDPGRAPILVEPVKAELALRGVAPEGLTVRALNPWGQPIAQIPVRAGADGAAFSIGEAKSICYLIERQ